MPADPPPSLLITPDRRRRLQQQYDEARQLAAARPEFRRIHELLAACASADPGNILYLDALLANLKRRDAAGARPWKWWTRLKHYVVQRPSNVHSILSTQYSDSSAAHAALASGPKILWTDSNDSATLLKLAAAAGDCDFDEVELRYLTAARELVPDDSTTLRMLARALTRQGRFENATGPWFAVLALAPGDAEAQQAVDDLRGVASATELLAGGGASLASADAPAQSLVKQAEVSRAAGQLDLAEHYLTQAQSAAGGDLGLLELRENLRLEKSQQRLEVARLRAAHDGDVKAQALVARLAQEHNRQEIEIYNLRAERLPADWQVRVQLAQRLKTAGNFSGAVQRLEEALRHAPQEPAVLVELGECWQHLRQFDKALHYYEEAIAAAGGGCGELAALARFRAGVLAAALDKPDVARRHFEPLATMEPPYRDAMERLRALPLADVPPGNEPGSTSV